MECMVHKLIADVAAFADSRVLLVRYRDTSRYDGQSGWFLPDDYLSHLEHPTDAARRILDEQVGITVRDALLSHIESFGNGAWHLAFHHRAGLDEPPPLRPSANVRDAKWFPLDGLPDPEDVAHHGWAIDVLTEMLGSGQAATA
jgi:ADP-ribose pyrophosphatase YjhB (NUDIX family)